MPAEAHDSTDWEEGRLTPLPSHPYELGSLFEALASPAAESLPDSARLTMLCRLAKPLAELLRPSNPYTLLSVVYPAPDYPPSREAYVGLCFGFGVATGGLDRAHAALDIQRQEIAGLKQANVRQRAEIDRLRAAPAPGNVQMDVTAAIGRTITSVDIRAPDRLALWCADGTALAVSIDLTVPERPRLLVEELSEAPPPFAVFPLEGSVFDHPLVEIDYTNWRGKRGTYTICPLVLYEGVTAYHPTPGRLLRAFVPAKRATRDFSVNAIHSVAAMTGLSSIGA